MALAIIVVTILIAKIARFNRKINNLKNENQLLKITIETNDAIIKKQTNIVKHCDDFLKKNANNFDKIQEMNNRLLFELKNANNLEKKQKLFDKIFIYDEK